MDTETTKKPREVRLGIFCLWAALALGLINLLVDISRFGTRLPALVLCLMFIFTFLFSAFFIYKISQGRSWARATYLILLLLGVASSLRGFPEEFGRASIMGALTVIRVLVLIYAAYLLFSYPSDAWFSSRRRVVAS